MVVAPLTGALVPRFGERVFMVGGLLLQATGMAWIGVVAEPDLAYAALIGPLLLSGVGVSMAIISAQGSVVGSVADEALGKAAGTNSMMRELGGVFGIAILVAVFAAEGDFTSPVAFTDGFAPAIGASAALAVAGAFAGLATHGRPAGVARAVPEPV